MIAQLIAAGVLLVFATTGFAFVQEYRDDGSKPNAAIDEEVAPGEESLHEEQGAPSPRIEVAPAPQPTYRTNCNQIRGTPYTGPEERSWFLTNCLGR